MRNKVFYFGLMIMIIITGISCGNKDKDLSGTYWVFEDARSNYITGDKINYYGLVFKDKKAADFLYLPDDFWSKLSVRPFEYEFKNGEGIIYMESKAEYDKNINEMKALSSIMGEKQTDEELQQLAEEWGALLRFRLSDDTLILSGKIDPRSPFYSKNTEYLYAPQSLEDIQTIFEGYP